MALGKYTRVDNRRSASSYCSTVTIVVFVALCLVGVWMMTSSSVVPVQNVDVGEENKSEVKEQVIETNDGNNRQFEDNPGDLPEDATKGDNNDGATQVEEKSEEKFEEKAEVKTEEKIEEKTEDGSKTETEDGGSKTEDGESKVESDGSNSEEGEKKSDGDNEKKNDSGEGEDEKKSDDGNEKKPENSDETKDAEKGNSQIEEKVEQTDKEQDREKTENGQVVNQSSNEVFPSVAQSELLNETATQNGSWATQSAESKNEKEAQLSSDQQTGYSWKLCNSTAGPDFIPCLDNLQAIRSLHSTKHYEHRERHCPEEAPTCLLPLPEGYKRPIEWPTSREKVYNVINIHVYIYIYPLSLPF